MPEQRGHRVPGHYPIDEGRTLPITKARMRYDWLSPWILFNLLLDVRYIVIMRRCGLGIKRRPEAIAVPQSKRP